MFWGAALAVAFAPWETGWLAWIALARPLHICLSRSAGGAFKSGYLFSLTFNALCLYWIGYVTPPGYLATILILSLYSASVFSLSAAVYRRWRIGGYLVFPILWIGMEHFRTLGEFSFPWTDLSYAQAYYNYFIQFASVTGAAGVSLAVALANTLLALALRHGLFLERRMTLVATAAVVIGFMFGYGWVVSPVYQDPPTIELGLLQGNFPLNVKWGEQYRDRVFAVYDSLATEAAADGARLVVWPETAAPVYLLYDRRYSLGQTERARASGVPNLIGTMHADLSYTPYHYFNAAVQLEADGEFSQPYLKQKLVPFAEHVPYQDKLPFLQRSFLEKYLTFIKTSDVEWWSDFYPGDSLVSFTFDSTRYIPLICFEVAYPEYVRAALHAGSEFILTITNDTWFRKSPGPYQHERIAIMRAVENRAWLARAANTGFTFFADPYGRVRESLDWYTRGYITGGVDPHYHPSPYYYHGPILARLCFIFTLVLSLFFILFRLGARLRLWSER